MQLNLLVWGKNSGRDYTLIEARVGIVPSGHQFCVCVHKNLISLIYVFLFFSPLAKIQSSWITRTFTFLSWHCHCQAALTSWFAQGLSEVLYEKLSEDPALSLVSDPELPGAERNIFREFKFLEAWSYLLIHRTCKTTNGCPPALNVQVP